MGRRKLRRALLLPLLLMAAGLLAVPAIHSVYAENHSSYQDLQLFTDVLSIVQKSYVEEVDTKDLIYGAIKGMLETLDPHSGFMPPEMYREMKIDTRGEFGGLGIEITIKDGVLTIVAPIEDTPAFRAGLLAGDQIVKIGDQWTKNITIMEAVKLMRGKPGTEISISIMRNNFDKPQDFTLKREIIQIKSVKSRLLGDGIGYIRLTQFQERTAAELRDALDHLHQEAGGKLQGLILDLRNNPGGLLDQAVEVSDTFLSNGLIVYTEGREEGSQMRFSAHAQGTEPDYPMVALINGGSASASEIVAGALHDHKRALILGVQSFGKGSVQTIIPLSDGSGLRLTTARYFTPSGISIQAKGITPDIEVPQVELKPVEDHQQFREEDLEHHFETPGAAGKGAQNKSAAPSDLTPEEQKDYQLLRAFDLLQGIRLFGQSRPAA
jgi:carboxyl-terminal processing protease